MESKSPLLDLINPPINPVDFANAIDISQKDLDYPVCRPPTQPLPPIQSLLEKIPNNFEVVKLAVETAATPREQLEVSFGMPLVFNSITRRYTLAPTAKQWFEFRLQSLNNVPTTPPILDINKSKIMMARRKNEENKKKKENKEIE